MQALWHFCLTPHCQDALLLSLEEVSFGYEPAFWAPFPSMTLFHDTLPSLFLKRPKSALLKCRAMNFQCDLLAVPTRGWEEMKLQRATWLGWTKGRKFHNRDGCATQWDWSDFARPWTTRSDFALVQFQGQLHTGNQPDEHQPPKCFCGTIRHLSPCSHLRPCKHKQHLVTNLSTFSHQF